MYPTEKKLEKNEEAALLSWEMYLKENYLQNLQYQRKQNSEQKIQDIAERWGLLLLVSSPKTKSTESSSLLLGLKVHYSESSTSTCHIWNLVSTTAILSNPRLLILIAKSGRENTCHKPI